MSVAEKEKTKKSLSNVTDRAQLEEVINRAIEKVGASKENDLCRYLPMEEGYIHHFTLRKMKSEEPSRLKNMLEEFIIDVAKPLTVPPKPRAPRGSRKRRDQIVFSKSELERMVNLARQAGYKDIISKLTPKKPLSSCKRELINSIKHNKVYPELWNSYVEAVNALGGGENVDNLSEELANAFGTTLTLTN